MDIKIEKLIDSRSDYFDKVCTWLYNWWGIRDGHSYLEIENYMEYSLSEDTMPQTFIALVDNVVVGMYQIVLNDMDMPPSAYPWLCNVYVDEMHRGKGIFKVMMSNVVGSAQKLNLKEVYLYTTEIGMYEKFGWEYIVGKDVERNNRVQRLYKLSLNKGDD